MRVILLQPATATPLVVLEVASVRVRRTQPRAFRLGGASVRRMWEGSAVTAVNPASLTSLHCQRAANVSSHQFELLTGIDGKS